MRVPYVNISLHIAFLTPSQIHRVLYGGHFEYHFANTYPIEKSVVQRAFSDPGVVSSIPARSHTLVEIGHGIFSMVILLLQLIQAYRKVRHNSRIESWLGYM